MTRHTHLCIDIRGMLRRMDSGELDGVMKRDDGHAMTRGEMKEALYDELSKGHRVLPFGKPCEGWSYEDGCPGHEGPAPTV